MLKYINDARSHERKVKFHLQRANRMSLEHLTDAKQATRAPSIGLGSTQSDIQWVPGALPGGKPADA